MHRDGRRVVITGANGFVARHVGRALRAQGDHVSFLSRLPAGDVEGCAVYAVDYGDQAGLRSILDELSPDVLFHLAGFTHIGASWAQPGACVRGTTEVTANVIAACVGRDCRLIHSSTGDVYGPGDEPRREADPPAPVTPYAVASVAAEQLCHVYRDAKDLSVTIVRPFNIYGPGQGGDKLVPLLLNAAMTGEPLPMTSGRQTRDFLFVDDAVAALVAIADSSATEGETFNVCSGIETPVADVAEVVAQHTRRVVAALGVIEHRPNEVWRHVGDPSKLAATTGWRARVTLDEGIARTVAEARGQDA